MTPTDRSQLRSRRAFSDAYETGRLFTLRVPTWNDEPMIVITAFDANRTHPHTGHSYIEVEVRQGGRVVFKRGALQCGVNQWTSTNGIEARELVMSLVAMQPGDTDEDYFADYTEDQLDWARKWGEHIGCIRESRYCDENGNVKTTRRHAALKRLANVMTMVRR